jgi:hypothetical protein
VDIHAGIITLAAFAIVAAYFVSGQRCESSVGVEVLQFAAASRDGGGCWRSSCRCCLRRLPTTGERLL